MKKYVKATSTLENPIPEISNDFDVEDIEDALMSKVFDWIGMEEIATNDYGFGYIGGWYKNDLILYIRDDNSIYLYKDAKSQKSNWEQLVTAHDWNEVHKEHPDWKVFWDWDESVRYSDINGFLSWFN